MTDHTDQAEPIHSLAADLEPAVTTTAACVPAGPQSRPSPDRPTHRAGRCRVGAGGPNTGPIGGTALRPRVTALPATSTEREDTVDQNEPVANPSTVHDRGPAAVVLVVSVDSRSCYRRLGPLAWTALVHLALNATQDGAGWVAPLGVRDLAAAIGVTKDTAARAVRALAAAGLVTRDRITTPEGPRRSGYRLTLPDPIRIVSPPPKRPVRPNPPPRTGGTPTGCDDPHHDPVDPPTANVQPPMSWAQPDLFATTADSADMSAANTELSQ